MKSAALTSARTSATSWSGRARYPRQHEERTHRPVHGGGGLRKGIRRRATRTRRHHAGLRGAERGQWPTHFTRANAASSFRSLWTSFTANGWQAGEAHGIDDRFSKRITIAPCERPPRQGYQQTSKGGQRCNARATRGVSRHVRVACDRIGMRVRGANPVPHSW